MRADKVKIMEIFRLLDRQPFITFTPDREHYSVDPVILNTHTQKLVRELLDILYENIRDDRIEWEVKGNGGYQNE